MAAVNPRESPGFGPGKLTVPTISWHIKVPEKRRPRPQKIVPAARWQ